MKATRTSLFIAFAILSLAFFAPAAEAKKENAPGIQKKIPLTISGLTIDLQPNSVTILWSTNKQSDSSLSLRAVPTPIGGDAILLYNPSKTTEHRISVESLVSGQDYEYIVISNDDFGNIAQTTGSFTTPRS